MLSFLSEWLSPFSAVFGLILGIAVIHETAELLEFSIFWFLFQHLDVVDWGYFSHIVVINKSFCAKISCVKTLYLVGVNIEPSKHFSSVFPSLSCWSNFRQNERSLMFSHFLIIRILFVELTPKFIDDQHCQYI